MREKILQLSAAFEQEMIDFRRRIHRLPEKGFQETETSRLITEELKKLDLEIKTGIALTGVTGLLRGSKPGKTLMLRADMDGLEIEEETGLDFSSSIKGMMHACGHDAHCAWVLGTAMILSRMREQLKGNVLFLFQPAEESVGGAEKMISAGVLEDPHVDGAVAAHVDPSRENRSGMIAVKYGTMCAAADNFIIRMSGPGGHNSSPHLSPDPLNASVHLYILLKNMLERKTDPLEPVILHVGTFHSGDTHNSIPGTAVLTGTVRTLKEKTRDFLHAEMKNLVFHMGKIWNLQIELEYTRGYPPLVNEAQITKEFHRSAENFLGRENVLVLAEPEMSGEDFSFFQHHVPGTYINIGTYNPELKAIYPLHSPRFMLDESIIPRTAALLANFAFTFQEMEK